MLTADAATALHDYVSERASDLDITHIRPVLNMMVSPILRVLWSCNL